MEFSKRVTAIEAIKYELERERKSMNMRLNSIVLEVVEELERAQAGNGPMASAHEGYSVILEEVDELWDEVKTNPKKNRQEKMKKEATQVAAMAIRFIYDLCKEGE